jgi:hypothetical protein
MMKMNSVMMELTTKCGHSPSDLPEELMELLKHGFKRVEGCIFFASMFPGEHLPDIDFVTRAYGDLTGYECVINKIHLEDFCEGNLLCVSQLFVQRFLDVWEAEFEIPVVAILSYEEDSEFGSTSVFRFHTKRFDETFINLAAIEEYLDPILVVEAQRPQVSD